jgi:hypothetical protein
VTLAILPRPAHTGAPRRQQRGCASGQKSCRSRQRGGAGLLVLLVLASAWGVVSITGDGPVSALSCTSQILVATVRTNESSYAPGQTVIISVTLTNEGLACSIPTPSPCGPTPPGASVYNSAGEDVWESGAGGGLISCPPEPVTSVTYPAGYSSTRVLDWRQDKCFLQLRPSQILHCPRTQVPAGRYRIIGSNGTSEQATAAITISN